MDSVIIFILGLVVGIILGILVISFCFISSESSKKEDEYLNEYLKYKNKVEKDEDDD